VPVEDPACRDRLREVLTVMRQSTIHAWDLQPDGTWRQRNGDPPIDAQVALMARALKEAKQR
jgi:polyphosphate kinase